MDKSMDEILNGPSNSTLSSLNQGQTMDEILGLSDGAPQQTSDPWEDFKNKAIDVLQTRKLSNKILPVLLGQAAIESARGTAAPGNNYFGIKGEGNAGSNNMATQEYRKSGYYGENSDFAAYKTPEDSINAYLNLILSYPGVKDAIASGNPIDILRQIEANGYATSPTYVDNVSNTPEFRQFNII